MLDLHCHILPNVDDGAASLEESLGMARFCVQDGISHVVATPHHHRYFRPLHADILRHVARLNEELAGAAVPLVILPGSEVQVTDTSEYRSDFEAGRYCHLGNGHDFTLIEFSWEVELYPPDAPQLIGWLRGRGMTPVVAHPERQGCFARDPARLRALVEAGAWLQVTVDSLLGNHGPAPRSAGELLVRTYPEVVLATDAHNLRRCSGLSAGFAWVRDRLGVERSQDLQARAERVLSALLGRASSLAVALAFAALAGAAPIPAQAAPGVDTTAAVAALRRFNEACALDGGALWGRSLCGPLALVDRETRLAIANRADSAGLWAVRDGAFVGRLPRDIGLANTAFDFGGTPWAMVLLPLPGDDFARVALLVHESFHRIQRDLGLWGSGPACPHLDTREGRLWLRLELRALAAAVRARGDSAARAANDALLFRWQRQRLFPAADSLEAQLEIQEGLAEFTGDKLALAATGLGEERVARDVERFEKRASYVRSMAYGTGPGLGLLLDRYAAGWRRRLTRDARLAAMLARALRVAPPAALEVEARRRGEAYGLAEVEAQEDAREHEREARAADYRARLVEGPTLTLRDDNMNVSFDPNSLVPLGDLGTAYPTGTFMAAWGKLEVEAVGALVGADFTSLVVPAPTDTAARTVRGPGWHLDLAAGWIVRPRDDRPGSYEVVRTGR